MTVVSRPASYTALPKIDKWLLFLMVVLIYFYYYFFFFVYISNCFHMSICILYVFVYMKFVLNLAGVEWPLPMQWQMHIRIRVDDPLLCGILDHLPHTNQFIISHIFMKCTFKIHELRWWAMPCHCRPPCQLKKILADSRWTALDSPAILAKCPVCSVPLHGSMNPVHFITMVLRWLLNNNSSIRTCK